jgi:CheY-like chemotaxis protein
MARILVLDDDLYVCFAIKTILERRGHSVVIAECGHGGIAFTEVHSFDAVIVDIFMPGLNGLETIRLIRQSEPDLKIVAISGYRFREGRSSAPDFFRMSLEFGASCYLHKPFTATEVVEAVEKYCLLLAPERRYA